MPPAPLPFAASRRIRRKVAPLDRFGPNVDFASELAERGAQYQGGTEFVAVNLPTYIRTSLDRVRAQLPDRPGLSSIIACCITHGLHALRHHEAVRETVRFRHDLNTWNGPAHLLPEIEELNAWVRSFKLNISDKALIGTRRATVRVPVELRSSLGEFCADLGLQSGALTVMTVVHALSDQPALPQERRDEFIALYAQFMHRVELRLRVGQRWLKEIK